MLSLVLSVSAELMEAQMVRMLVFLGYRPCLLRRVVHQKVDTGWIAKSTYFSSQSLWWDLENRGFHLVAKTPPASSLLEYVAVSH